MITVWKFEVESSEISMPKGAEILHIDVQRETPCLWARVDTDCEHETRTFAIVGTGHPCPSGCHIGSFLMRGGDFVFHVFETTQ